MPRTNVMRLLDAAGIPYETVEYDYDEKDLSGIHAAAATGIPARNRCSKPLWHEEKNGAMWYFASRSAASWI